MVLHLLCLVFLIPAAGATLYYALLAACAFPRRDAADAGPAEAVHSFAVVIPAHDEERTLPASLESCAALDYPADKFRVFVVADNCTDRTAEVARAGGVICLERRDTARRGKGFALEWAFARVLPPGFDAVVVLDADCRLDRHALRAFDHCLAAGDRVLQASYVASNPDASATSYAVAVGNALENELFYAPKSRLGLAVFLRGTGMVLHSDVLARHPWDARSAVEDTEYSVRLLRAGLPIRFLRGVRVWSDFPQGRDDLRVQRARWAGNVGFGRREALGLLADGLLRGRPLLIDAGWTLGVLSRPLVLLQLLAALALAGLGVWQAPGSVSAALLAAALTLAAMQGAYFALGVALLGLDRRRFRRLLGAPLVVLELLGMALAGMVRSGTGPWVRTPRTGAAVDGH
jgi:glycosyltransferase involved in cell wall biosynthesis